MSPLQLQITLASLNKMMRSSFFSICEIDRLGEMLGVPVRSTQAYKLLYPLHCMHWDQMPNEVREAVPGLIKECLGTPVSQFNVQTEVVDLAVLKIVDPPVPFRQRILRLIKGQS